MQSGHSQLLDRPIRILPPPAGSGAVVLGRAVVGGRREVAVTDDCVPLTESDGSEVGSSPEMEKS